MAITPDGSRVIFVGGSGARLMARSLDALEAVELARGSSISSPFVSPDGRWVGYVDAANRLMKVPALGGRASTVATLDGRVSGATWLDEHTIIASTLASTGLLRVSADGSASPVAITAPDQGLDHVLPQRLPEGRSVLFGVISRDEPQYGVHRLQKLDVTTGLVSTLLDGGGSYADASAVRPGHLAYLDNHRLLSLPFDLAKLVVPRDATPHDTGIRASAFAVSDDGTLVYAEPDANVISLPRSLVWVDRDGSETAIAAEPRPCQHLQASPDGRRVAVAALGDGSDIGLLDAATSALTRLTFDRSTETAPVWTPDGLRIVFASNRDTGVFNLWWQPADGTGRAERLTHHSAAQFPTAITPDGRHAIFSEVGEEGRRDLKMVALDGTEHVTPLLESPDTDELLPAISPDGRWLAFESDRSGPREVFVRPFPEVDRGLWQISSGGGRQPAWSRDGAELFYFGADGSLMSTRVSAQAGALRLAPPQRLLEPRHYGARLATLLARSYNVLPGSRRFIAIKAPAGQATSGRPGIVLVQHWSTTLASRGR